MKKFFLALALVVSISTTGYCKTDTCFSPYQNCEDVWVNVIDSAKQDIVISCFGLTNRRIGDRLIAKHKEGVKVLVLTDKRQSSSKYDLAQELSKNGIEVVVKKTTALEHNKMMVVDNKFGILGSWNLSGNAQKQDNSLIVTDEESIVAQMSYAMDRIYKRDKV